jgi:hypothetical protein
MSGTGIAGAADYGIRDAPVNRPCFVCRGPIEDAPVSVRVAAPWGQIRACSATCRESDRFRLAVRIYDA